MFLRMRLIGPGRNSGSCFDVNEGQNSVWLPNLELLMSGGLL